MSSHEHFSLLIILLLILAPQMLEDLIAPALLWISKGIALCGMAAFLYFLYFSNFTRVELEYFSAISNAPLDWLIQFLIGPMILAVLLIRAISRLDILEPMMFFLGSLLKKKNRQSKIDKRIEPLFDFDEPSSN
jgi:hypothetical protein